MFWNRSKVVEKLPETEGATERSKVDLMLKKYPFEMRFYEATSLIKFFKEYADVFRNERIRGILAPMGLEWSINKKTRRKVYSETETIFIEFDSFAMEIYYCFASDLTINLRKNGSISGNKCTFEYDGHTYARNGYITFPDKTLSEVIISRFSSEFEVDGPSSAVRIDGGDYFSDIIFMCGDRGLRLNPKPAFFDGYLDYELVDRQDLEDLIMDPAYYYERIILGKDLFSSKPNDSHDAEEHSGRSCAEWKNNATRNVAELRRIVSRMNLEGREIEDIKLMSHIYNMTDERFAELAHKAAEEFPQEFRQEFCSKELPDYFPIPLCLELKEPILIKFKDGARLEVFAPTDGCFNISMNQILEAANGIDSKENVNVSKLLAFCKGAKITRAEVVTGTDFDGSEILIGISIGWKRDGEDEYAFLVAGTIRDFMELSIVTKKGKPLSYPYGRLKKCLCKA